MSVYNAEYHAMVHSPGPTTSESVTVTANKSGTADTTGNQDEGFFHHLLDVVNPLQHLPVIGTIYRAITGEHIGPVEQIAGDTLYGGLWGGVSSVAEVAYQSIAGKSVEDTVMGWLGIGSDGNSDIASQKVAAPSIALAQSLPSGDMPSLPGATQLASAAPDGADFTALASSLSARGLDSATASRALDAYRRTVGMALQPQLLSTVN
jgi:hypothetical protein